MAKRQRLTARQVLGEIFADQDSDSDPEIEANRSESSIETRESVDGHSEHAAEPLFTKCVNTNYITCSCMNIFWLFSVNGKTPCKTQKTFILTHEVHN